MTLVRLWDFISNTITILFLRGINDAHPALFNNGNFAIITHNALKIINKVAKVVYLLYDDFENYALSVISDDVLLMNKWNNYKLIIKGQITDSPFGPQFSSVVSLGSKLVVFLNNESIHICNEDNYEYTLRDVKYNQYWLTENKLFTKDKNNRFIVFG